MKKTPTETPTDNALLLAMRGWSRGCAALARREFARSLGRKRLAPADLVAFSSACAAARSGLSVVTGVAALVLAAQPAKAALLRPPPSSAAASNAGAQAAGAAVATTQQQAAQVQLAQNSLARAAQAIQAMQAAQAAARTAAMQAAAAVPNGLVAGGLVVAPGATPGSVLWQNANAPTSSVSGGMTTVEIDQTAAQAILTWNQFNIGQNTQLYFNQSAGGASAPQWIALNRVTDPSLNPSQILGSIKAQGQVYIINPNGIIFGGGSQVNVQTLMASTLDFNGSTVAAANARFQQGIAFDDNDTAAAYRTNYTLGVAPGSTAPVGNVKVNAGAQIVTADDGAIFLFGKNVTNAGTITTPDGQTVMAAGQQVWVTKNSLNRLPGQSTYNTDPNLRGIRAVTQNGGEVENDGMIESDRGNIMLSGKNITNTGVLLATTSATANGSVILLAGDGAAPDPMYWIWATSMGDLTLAPRSLIAINPDNSQGTALASQFLPSQISFFAQNIRLESGATIYAPAANVTFSATTPSASESAENDPSSIEIDSGAVISLAGLVNVQLPMSYNDITGQLNLAQLANDPVQRTGPLHGVDVTVDMRLGTTFADMSGYYALIQQSASQSMTNGGSLKLDAGNITTAPGSLINLSGGSVQFLSGYVSTTQLLGTDGRVYSITNANPNFNYAGIYGTYTQYQQDYIQGGDAGGLIIGPQKFDDAALQLTNPSASGVRPYGTSFQGNLVAGTLVGPYQRNAPTGTTTPQTSWQEIPASATLTIGYVNSTSTLPTGPSVTIGGTVTSSGVTLPPQWFNGSTFGAVNIISGIGGGNLTIEPGVNVNLGAFGSFDFTGSHALIDGSITSPGGTVTIAANWAEGYDFPSNTYINFAALTPSQRPWINLGPGAAINVSGGWVNDLLSPTENTPLAVNGGSVSFLTVGNLILSPGSTINVDGGGRLTSGNLLVRGNAGSLSIRNNLLPTDTDGFSNALSATGAFDVFDAGLSGYALGTGGTLTLGIASSVTITSAPAAVTDGSLTLSPQFFQQNGFASYSIAAADNMTVAPGTQLRPFAMQYVQGAGLWSLPTGGSIASVSTTGVIDPQAGYLPVNPALFSSPTLTYAQWVAKLLNGSLGFSPSDMRQTMGLTFATSLTSGTGAPVSQMPPPVLTVAEGAVISLDPKSTVTLNSSGSLIFDGVISAPGGTIVLSVTNNFSSAAITLGAASQLLAAGYVQVTPATGFSTTSSGGSLNLSAVEPGGTVSITGTANEQFPVSLLAEPGSLIDVSGTEGTATLLGTASGPLGTRGVYVSENVPSNAGSVNITIASGGLIAGTILSQPGGAGASGGTVDITAGSLSGGGAPSILVTGTQQNPANTLTLVLPSIVGGGVSNLTLASISGVSFDGTVNLSLGQSLFIDTPLVGISPGSPPNSSVTLSAPYVSFGYFPGVGTAANPAPPVASTPTTISGTLTVNAGLIDFAQVLDLGGNGLVGFTQTNFNSLRDIRFSPGSIVGARLQSAGSITLTSAQAYVTTTSGNPQNSTYTIESGTSVTFLSNGVTDPVPYSYGGILNVTAPDITQAGILRAPYGTINLTAPNALTLAPGSLTSVSLDGLIVPYGAVSNGIFSTDATQISDSGAIPVKSIALNGKTIAIQKGATVDVSGGGDLYAWEFVAGNGGTTDILSQPGRFAVLPGYTLGAAPIVPANSLASTSTSAALVNTSGLNSSSLQVGRSVYLSGVSGLPSGVYILLPAYYALLPGGVAIQALSTGYAPGGPAPATQPDGSQIVSGYTLVQGTGVLSPVTTRFLTMSGTVLRSYSQYNEYSFNSAVTSLATGAGLTPPLLPRDAGSLILNATNSLALDGEGLFGAATGGQLGTVDIAALKIALVGDGKTAPDSSYLTLDATQFTDFGIGSLLLGGTRTATATGTAVTVTATDIIVANDAASALTIPELLLASTGTISIDSGSVLRATGTASGNTAPLLLSGDGALVRLSTGSAVTVTRTGATGAAGNLALGANVTLAATGSLLLSGTQTVTTDAGLSLTSPQVALLSSGISLGTAPAGTAGLVLDSAALASLAATKSLTLTASGTIDLYGAVALGGAAMNNLMLDASGLNGFGASGDITTLTAGAITLQNSSGGTALATTGSGSLALNTSTLTLGSGVFAVNGFSGVAATAVKTDATGTGSLTVSAPLTLNTAMLTAGKGSNYQITSTGAVSLAQATGSTPTPDAFGGRLSVTGASVALNTTVDLPAGIVALTATTGDLTLGANAKILTQGVSKAFYDVSQSVAAGSVTLTADTGNVTAAAGSVIDVSGNAAGAAGGCVTVAAAQSAGTFSGTLLGNGATGTPGGSFALDAGTTANFTALNDALNAGGFNATRSVILQNAGITLNAGDTIAAHDVTLQSGTGAVTIDGAIAATGTAANPNGGTITLTGGNGVTLGSGAVLDTSTPYAATATGYATTSGSVSITANAGSVAVASGSVINAGGGGNANGSVIIAAQRAGNDVLVSPLAGTLIAPSVIVRGNQTYDQSATGTVNAGDVTTMLSDAATWMANAGAIQTRLGDGVVVQPGILVTAGGDLTIGANGNALDLHTARYGSNAVPGAITFTAGGNLTVNANISDGFSSTATSGTLLTGSSWSLAFNAGGNLTLAASTLIRTGTGNITIATGGDLDLTNTTSVIYTAGSNAPNATGFTATGRVGNYPVNGGNLAITVGGDINAPVPTDFITGWLYRYGYANTSAGNATSQMTVASQTSWSVVFANFDQGIGALGGGNISITAGGDIHDLSVVLPTTGQMTTPVGSTTSSSDIVVRGGGNLNLSTGGNIDGGIYMLGQGAATLSAGNSITSDVQTLQRTSLSLSGPTINLGNGSFAPRNLYASFALSDSTLALTARNDVQVEAIVDPMMIPVTSGDLVKKLGTYFTSYTTRTSVSMTSVAGNVIYDNNPWAGADLTIGSSTQVNQYMNVTGATDSISNSLLYVPGTFSLTALQGDIALNQYFSSGSTAIAFSLAPEPDGNLTMLAEGNISSQVPVIMMDVAPEYVRTAAAPFQNQSSNSLTLGSANQLGAATNYGRGTTPLHATDTTSALIYSLEGSIIGQGQSPTEMFTLKLPKTVAVRVGGDLTNVSLSAQNNSANAITVVEAGGNITASNLTVIGPGQLEAMAGGSISFVSPEQIGLTSVGNQDTTVGTQDGPAYTGTPVTNLTLPATGAGITVLAGTSRADLTAFANEYLSPNNTYGVAQTYLPQLATFMNGLGYTGDTATLLADFNALGADARRPFLLSILFDELRTTGIGATGPNHTGYQRGYAAIATMFPSGAGTGGDINFYGQAVQTQEGGDIMVAAPYGSITVDENSNHPNSGGGGVTQKGGDISMLASGDIGLGNSRVFTLEGGNILMWTSQGNITAGNGSNTNAVLPALSYLVDNYANVILNAQGLQTGSGIGVLDAGTGPVKSRLDLIAPVGTVDAGDAGIRSAGALNIAALVVLGANNISAAGPVSGVPVAAVPNVSAAVAASTTSAASSSGASEEMKRQQAAANAQEPASVFTVEVLGYGGGSGDDDDASKKKKHPESASVAVAVQPAADLLKVSSL